ncbi:unnamed protein product [Schistosoma turkestanicum]|nr:unnamed protein product [Schistosoma turkestanicum]
MHFISFKGIVSAFSVVNLSRVTPLRNMATKVGVVQMLSTADKKRNFEQAVKYIVEAKSSEAKIVFLPECFDFVGRSRQEVMDLSEMLDGPLITEYRALAARESLWISLGGAHIKTSQDDDRLYNSHIVIDSSGQIAGVYHKVHLFDANLSTQETTSESASRQSSFFESKVIRAGPEAPITIQNSPVGNLGLAICYDMRFPELASHLRYAKNAHVLTYPSAYATRTGEAGHWHTLIRARAIENQCYVVAAAQEGEHNEKRSSYGHSLVVDPWGQIIAEQLNPGPGLLICEIGPFTMADATTSIIPKIYHVRQSMPVEYHRRLDLFPMSDSGHPRPIQSADFNFGPHLIKSDCVFYQSKLSFAFVNISPLVPGHILVCPIACVERFCHLNGAQVADLYITVRQIAERLPECFPSSSLTISIQDGKDAGQSVPHVHVHVLPRKPNDFPENDDIYKALQNHDKVKHRIYRSHDVMSQEAKQLRQLYCLLDGGNKQFDATFSHTVLLKSDLRLEYHSALQLLIDNLPATANRASFCVVIMEPLFSCTKCLHNFPQSEMSRSGQTCKGCSPHHSTFKQCEYCKSDFKYHYPGGICPHCQSMKNKYGEPQSCSICKLRTAFGSALVCQRCLHYRNRFGEPRQCNSCGNICAFLKDEASREKVDGQILCWVCTYNFKLARSKERSSHGLNKRRHDSNPISTENRSKPSHDSLKKTCTGEYGARKIDTQALTTQALSLDSVYNEHLLTISQLQDEIKSLKRQLTLKDADLLTKDRTIAELRSDMIDIKNMNEDRIQKIKSAAQLEQDRLLATIRQLQKEKAMISQDMKRRRSNNNLTKLANRHSLSSTTLFSPDSPLSVSGTKRPVVNKTSTTRESQVNERAGEETLSNTNSTSNSTNRSVKKQLTPNSSVQNSDDDSNLTPQRTVTASVMKQSNNSNTNTSSPDITPSISSGPLTDNDDAEEEEEEDDGEQTRSQPYHYNPQEFAGKDPLGLDTPSESENETPD